MLASVGVSDHVFGGATVLVKQTANKIVGLLTTQEATASASAAASASGRKEADVDREESVEFEEEEEVVVVEEEEEAGYEAGSLKPKSPLGFVQEDLVFPGPQPITPESLLLRAFVASSPQGKESKHRQESCMKRF
jgi:hypothetical protein